MEHILVVDDNAINCKVLAARLEAEGYCVQQAAGGREAMSLIETAPVDLVVLDIMMPEVSGLDVLKRIRAMRTLSELPVIMATAKSGSDDLVEALALGASDYVTKPIDFPVLLARMRTQLRLKNLAQEKDEFVRIASHDLKNPLAIIVSSLDLIRSFVPAGATMPDDMPEVLERAVRHTKTMQRIISDFLDFDALDGGNLALSHVPLDLVEVVGQALEMLKDVASGKGISLCQVSDSPSFEVVGDPHRLQQVIHNIAGNSIRFSGPGTSVRICLCKLGESAKVAISDEGPGLAPEDFQKLFRKYARLSNRPTSGEKSSGLGLAICAKLIAAHGGTVGAENNSPYPGTTFWFTLPLAHSQQA